MIIKNAISQEVIQYVSGYYLKKFNDIRDWEFSEGERTGDVVEPYCFTYYNDPMTYTFLENLKELIEEKTKKSLLITYCYTRMYRTGSWLVPHTDRPACEYSITTPITGEPWDIYIGDTPVSLSLGDLVIYKGCDAKHWRKKLKGPDQIQLHLHYVDANGPNKWCKGDNQNNPNT